jgi:hypothetical protein
VQEGCLERRGDFAKKISFVINRMSMLELGGMHGLGATYSSLGSKCGVPFIVIIVCYTDHALPATWIDPNI